ncbi:MAG: hypothetical protein U1E59_20940 [Amaricoccus sp.]
MKRQTILAAALALVAAPALAQEKVTCGDYSAMDNAKQMETIADIEALAKEMSFEEQLTADAIHEKLAAGCKDKVDVTLIDILKGN